MILSGDAIIQSLQNDTSLTRFQQAKALKQVIASIPALNLLDGSPSALQDLGKAVVRHGHPEVVRALLRHWDHPTIAHQLRFWCTPRPGYVVREHVAIDTQASTPNTDLGRLWLHLCTAQGANGFSILENLPTLMRPPHAGLHNILPSLLLIDDLWAIPAPIETRANATAFLLESFDNRMPLNAQDALWARVMATDNAHQVICDAFTLCGTTASLLALRMHACDALIVQALHQGGLGTFTLTAHQALATLRILPNRDDLRAMNTLEQRGAADNLADILFERFRGSS